MIIEKNNINVPSDLDEEFFKEALENGLREDRLKIEGITFTLGSAGGENYCSNIYRAIIRFQRLKGKKETVSVIIKSMPITESNTFLVEIKAFVREKIIYFDILPKMEVLLSDTKFGPKCYYALGHPVQTIVFEDLKTKGYMNADRQEGLDEEHCRLVLMKLAKFHAASMILAEKDPSLMRHFPAGIFNPYIIDTALFHAVFIANLDYISSSVITQWPGFEEIAEKLRNILSNLQERCLNVIKLRDGEVRVLNHGDMWVNNFMFKYDKVNTTTTTTTTTSKPTEAVFIDFQMSFYSSPGIDLNYFLNTSVRLDVLKNKREQLLRVYHQTLEATLNKFGCSEIPTFNDIKNEAQQKEFYGLMTAIGLFPLLAMDKDLSHDNSLDALVDEDIGLQKRKDMFSSKRFEDTMKYSLKRFNELGILD